MEGTQIVFLAVLEWSLVQKAKSRDVLQIKVYLDFPLFLSQIHLNIVSFQFWQ